MEPSTNTDNSVDRFDQGWAKAENDNSSLEAMSNARILASPTSGHKSIQKKNCSRENKYQMIKLFLPLPQPLVLIKLFFLLIVHHNINKDISQGCGNHDIFLVHNFTENLFIISNKKARHMY